MSAVTIRLEYALNSRPRYGHGKPPHAKLYEVIDSGREKYHKRLANFAQHARRLSEISENPGTDPSKPHWRNGFFSGIDAVAVFGMVAELRPRQIIEIGSGNSTKFFRHAIVTNQLDTHLVSIDTEPRAEINALCDEIIRAPLEDVPTDFFDRCQPGDFVFFDGSHTAYMNSDVTAFFLEVLPNLPSGVFVQIHDIFLPYDYPPAWMERYYSEQYLLACYLLSADPGFEIELPNLFISCDAELQTVLNPIWSQPGMESLQRHGGSFWLRTSGRRPPSGSTSRSRPQVAPAFRDIGY